MGVRVCVDCPRLTTGTRCQQCQRAYRQRNDKRRPNARARGYDTRWERTRKQYLAAFPICQWHEGCLNPAVDVHHLDGKGPSGEHGHDWHNLAGLCHAHHSKITATTQPGGFR